MEAEARPTSFSDARTARYAWDTQHRGLGNFIKGSPVLEQRESSATIKAAPIAYEQAEPAKPKNILEFDCRGLEFVDFKPDVGAQLYS